KPHQANSTRSSNSPSGFSLPVLNPKSPFFTFLSIRCSLRWLYRPLFANRSSERI
ncbi:MAG: hypothetical protein L6R39_005906, partial [Caloplaca ligustica]